MYKSNFFKNTQAILKKVHLISKIKEISKKSFKSSNSLSHKTKTISFFLHNQL